MHSDRFASSFLTLSAVTALLALCCACTSRSSIQTSAASSSLSAAAGSGLVTIQETPVLDLDLMSGALPLQLRLFNAGGTGVAAPMYHNSSGVLTAAPENLLLESQSFDETGAWNSTGFPLTVTPNAAIAPDGTQTAAGLVPTTESNQHIVYQAAPIAAGSTVTFSVYVKPAGYHFIQLQLRRGDSTFTDGAQVTFDLANGSVAGQGSPTGFGTYLSSSIQALSSGWYRVSLTGVIDGTATSAMALLLVWNNSQANQYAGDGSSGIYAWGAQLEQGATASSYIPTTTTPAYGARFDYNPVTLQLNGLLLEESRTNLLTYSQAIGSGSWTEAFSTIALNAGAAPDGSGNASRIQNTATAGVDNENCATISGLTVYTLSIYAKQVTGTWTQLQFTDNVANGCSANFNLATGAVPSAGTFGSYTGCSAGVRALPAGWYRLSLTATSSPGASSVCLNVKPVADGSSNATNVGDATLVWGAQLEQGPFATSFIPTGSTCLVSGNFASRKGSRLGARACRDLALIV